MTVVCYVSVLGRPHVIKSQKKKEKKEKNEKYET